jgi:galactose mutarotase-like enzyme
MLLFTAFFLYLSPIFSPLILPAAAAAAASPDAPSPFAQYTIAAPGITATLIPYGARLTHLLVPDNTGSQRDVVLGYDDPKQYLADTLTNHTYFGPIVGRYANRIRNGTFTLPATGSQEFHIPENDNKGLARRLHWLRCAELDRHCQFKRQRDFHPPRPGGLPRLRMYTV